MHAVSKYWKGLVSEKYLSFNFFYLHEEISHPLQENRLKLKLAVFWVVAPYSLAEVYRRFRGVCYLYHRPDKAPLGK
jgi:hypothetical protein